MRQRKHCLLQQCAAAYTTLTVRVHVWTGDSVKHCGRFLMFSFTCLYISDVFPLDRINSHAWLSVWVTSSSKQHFSLLLSHCGNVLEFETCDSWVLELQCPRIVNSVHKALTTRLATAGRLRVDVRGRPVKFLSHLVWCVHAASVRNLCMLMPGPLGRSSWLPPRNRFSVSACVTVRDLVALGQTVWLYIMTDIPPQILLGTPVQIISTGLWHFQPISSLRKYYVDRQWNTVFCW